VRAAILRCDAGVENEHPERGNRKGLLGENRVHHEHAYVWLEVTEDLPSGVRVDVVDVMNGRTLIR
jgi:hypothetical protein